MVFDPTFHEISEEADALPDLAEADPDLGEIDDPTDGDLEADDLPPVGD
jgi:hypothetical protein